MSRRVSSIRAALVSLGVGLVWMAAGLSGQSGTQPSTKNGEWPDYTADIKGTKYSPLDQINASNFNKLEVAWRFKTDSLGPRPEYKLEGRRSWSRAWSTRPPARGGPSSRSMQKPAS